MIPAPDMATLLARGLDLCARPALPAVPAVKATKTKPAADAIPAQRACGHVRRLHAPCTAIVTPAVGKKAAEICGCPEFVEA